MATEHPLLPAASGPHDSGRGPATDEDYARAGLALSEMDPVIARLLESGGRFAISESNESNFSALVRAITSQQLAERVAKTIFARLVDGVGGSLSPQTVLAQSDVQLRAMGLSHAKALSVRDLAERVASGTTPVDSQTLLGLDNEEVINRLSEVRGIGPWTAEVFLMFQLRRLDVWPAGDLGIRRGYAVGWGVPVPTIPQLLELGDKFRPYRTIAALCCWRAIESQPPAQAAVADAG